jgi:hypothetical protein
MRVRMASVAVTVEPMMRGTLPRGSPQSRASVDMMCSVRARGISRSLNSIHEIEVSFTFVVRVA